MSSKFIAAAYSDDGRVDLGEFVTEADALDACETHAYEHSISKLVWEGGRTYLTARCPHSVYHIFKPKPGVVSEDATNATTRKRSPKPSSRS